MGVRGQTSNCFGVCTVVNTCCTYYFPRGTLDSLLGGKEHSLSLGKCCAQPSQGLTSKTAFQPCLAGEECQLVQCADTAGDAWNAVSFPDQLMQGQGNSPHRKGSKAGQCDDHVCVQPGDLGARCRERLGAPCMGVGEGKSGPGSGYGSGHHCPGEGSMPGLPPAEESSRGRDEDGKANWAQSGTSGWAGSELSPRR